MSIQFNDTVNYKGLVQIYEKECGFGRGDISGDIDKLKEFAADSNLSLDDLFRIGFQSSGTWQLDDTNSSGYPIITTQITSGQRDYQFIQDQYGNLVLDIHRVIIYDVNGKKIELLPVDQQTPGIQRGYNSQGNTDNFVDGQNTTGTPTKYDKTGNAIILDIIPNYTRVGGMELFINREPSYFNYGDTIKKAGIPGNLHRYLALKPAMDTARRLSLASYDRLAIEVQKYEEIIIPDVFGRRQKDVKNSMRANVELTR